MESTEEREEGRALEFLLWPVDHPWGIAAFMLLHFAGLAVVDAACGGHLTPLGTACALAWTALAGAAVYLAWPAGACAGAA